MQGKNSNYDTDIFMPIISAVEELAGRKYGGSLTDKADIAFRVIADHLRTLVFAIADGCNPSNEGRGYVIRRILRRGSRFGRVLGLHEPFLCKLIGVLAETMGAAFPEIADNGEFVSTVIEAEEQSFNRTLDRGIEIFNTAAKKAQKSKKPTISGSDAFQLYDTFGFPLDLTQLMARERGLDVDVETFTELMAQQRSRARAAQKSASFAASLTGAELPATDDTAKYKTDSLIAKTLGWIDDSGYHDKGEITETTGEIAVVLDKTCFYAESGGQLGDAGSIESSTGKFIVENTEKIADTIIHKGKITAGHIDTGTEAKAIVDANRNSSKKNHTATHLLQRALQQILGDKVRQQGSLVGPDYLRFDFTYPKALASKHIKEIEHIVNQHIAADLPVSCTVMPIDEAKDIGAMALFNEKYGDEVRIVGIGAEQKDILKDAYSKEFCGGTHVDRTAQIGGFKIIKEESISAGVRRITALTGEELIKYYQQRSETIDDICDLLKARPEEIFDRVKKLIDDNKSLNKKLKAAAKTGGADFLEKAKQLLADSEKIADSSIVISQIEAVSVEQVRSAIDMIKKKAKSAAVVFAFADDGKVMIIAAVTDDLIKKGLKAGDIVKQIAPIVGGGGGGRSQMAQAGGKNPEKIPEALKKAKDIIKSILAV